MVNITEETLDSYHQDSYGNQEIISEDIKNAPLAENVGQSSEITLNDFQLLKFIGKGYYGRVFQVRKIGGKHHDQMLAMKAIKKSSLSVSKKAVAQVQAERNILEKVDHPFIIEMKYAFQTEFRVYFVMDFAIGGDLYSYITNHRIMCKDEARFVAAEITLALEYLHGLRVIYRDLKTENVMFDSQGHVKLVDFGFSKEMVDLNTMTNTFCGTRVFMAPEIISKSGHNKDVDWWSLGILLFVMLTGYDPYLGLNSRQTSEAILKCKITFPPHIAGHSRDLISRLCERNRFIRLGSGGQDGKAVRRHPFFQDIRWDDLLNGRLQSPLKLKSTEEDATSNFDLDFTRKSVWRSEDEPGQGEGEHFQGFYYVHPSMLEE